MPRNLTYADGIPQNPRLTLAETPEQQAAAQEDEDNYLVLTHRRYALVPRRSYADGDTGQRDDWYDVVEYATYADGAVERHVLDTLLEDVAESMIAHIRRAAPEF